MTRGIGVGGLQVFSTGTVSPSVVGTTYLALTDIARMKATKTNSEEGDIVTLPLHRPSGRTQGSIRISVNLCGATIQQMMYALGKSYHLILSGPSNETTVYRSLQVNRTKPSFSKYLTCSRLPVACSEELIGLNMSFRS